MDSETSSPHPDSEVLGKFFEELDRDREAKYADYAQRHPALAARLRALLRLGSALSENGSAFGPNVPERLGDFRIERLVGRGGMGEVYEAVQEHLGRRVAVKVIRRDQASPDALRRFLREQEVLAKLHQSHIVPIYFAGRHGGLDYFVMPFIEGAPLHRLLDAVGRLEPSQAGSKTPALSELVPKVLPEAAPAPVAPVQLSHAYFRSVASLMADAAEAVQHAHDAEVLHRDLKPSNLMLDKAGTVWIIDFGLSCYLNATPEGEPTEAPPAVTTAAGTLAYMAPEQFEGKPDPRSDVWGLGATLYEMLTLRRAFPNDADKEEMKRRIRHEEPPWPRRLVPRDLQEICRKALRKDPAQRYASAKELAADLRRWLAGEPVRARGAQWPRWVGLWVRRHRAAAVAVFFLLAAIVTGFVVHTENRLAFADAKERLQRRAGLRLEIQKLGLGPHYGGWWDKSWEFVEEATKLPGDDLRDLAAATLLGLDVNTRASPRFPGLQASSVAIDRGGRRVLFGGVKGEPAHLWEGGDAQPAALGQPGRGPVAFADDGTPLQLVVNSRDRGHLLLWDAARQQKLQTFAVPRHATAEEDPDGERPVLWMSADGAFVAAADSDGEGRGWLAVWNGRTGKPLRQCDTPATAVAVSPDGSLVASGDEGGRLRLRSLTTDTESILPFIGSTKIRCLAFHADVRRTADARPGWLLAVGEAGGRTVVWDLDKRLPRQSFLGANHGVDAVAFSPDNMTLATAGLHEVWLWDLATGRPLLSLRNPGFNPGLVFSGEGKHLGCANVLRYSEPNNCHVWPLEDGRGLRALRGLTAQVSKVALSPDGRHLAALSHDWKVGVWDLEQGRLLHLLEVPEGPYADNAALALRGDGCRLAVASWREAVLWDLETPRREKPWALPRGLVETMAFTPDGGLALARMEQEQGGGGADLHPPYALRLRKLHPGREADPGQTLASCCHRVFAGAVTADGSSFAFEWASERNGPHTVAVFGGAKGERKWSKVLDKTGQSATLLIDSNGTKLAYYPGNSFYLSHIVKLVSGEPVEALSHFAPCIHPGAGYLVRTDNTRADVTNYGLFRIGRQEPLVLLGIGTPSCTDPQFDAAGARLVWGNRDGTVTVCDLEEIRQRLNTVGLGWEPGS